MEVWIVSHLSRWLCTPKGICSRLKQITWIVWLVPTQIFSFFSLCFYLFLYSAVRVPLFLLQNSFFNKCWHFIVSFLFVSVCMCVCVFSSIFSFRWLKKYVKMVIFCEIWLRHSLFSGHLHNLFLSIIFCFNICFEFLSLFIADLSIVFRTISITHSLFVFRSIFLEKKEEKIEWIMIQCNLLCGVRIARYMCMCVCLCVCIYERFENTQP